MVSVYKNSIEVLNTHKLTFGDRVEFLINKRGISKLWLAEKLGITKQALNYLIKHSSKPKYIDALAEIMQANPAWIEFGEGLPFESFNSKISSIEGNMLKIYDSQSVMKFFKGEDKQSENDLFIDYKNQNSECFFAFRIENDSIFPPFMENTILIFEKDATPSNNDYVLIHIKQNDSVIVRQYSKDGRDVYYNSKNKDYKSLVNIDVNILGVLVEARYLL